MDIDAVMELGRNAMLISMYLTVPLLGASLIIGLISLFGLGLFLGHISGRSLISYGLRTTIAGVVAIALNFLLDKWN